MSQHCQVGTGTTFVAPRPVFTPLCAMGNCCKCNLQFQGPPYIAPLYREAPAGDIHKKTHAWTANEDQRLCDAVREFGTDNWTLIAQFVGNGRTRAQCSQRWLRGLNPSISKTLWSEEEDNLLIDTVKRLGSKSWGKIAAVLGNRCDVQCRYRYNILVRTKHVENVKESSKRIRDAKERTKLPPIAEFLSDSSPIETNILP